MLPTVLVFFATLLVVYWWLTRPPSNLPPSPGLALPVVGHLYLFQADVTKSIEDWKRRLGCIFTLQMGPQRCVILNGYPLISETLLKQHERLLARPNNFSHEELFDYAGIISLGGEKWKQQRAFLQTSLRALGMGRNVMAERIKIEVDHLLATMEADNGEARDIRFLVMVGMTNVICGILFGKRFHHEDEIILHWLKIVKRLFSIIGSSAVLNFFSFLKYVPGDFFHYKELRSIVLRQRATLRQWVDKENRQVNVADEAFEDLAQAFLTEIEKKQQQGIRGTTLDEANLIATSMALFNAGVETGSNTIMFGVLYLLHYPELQQKIYKEIAEVVGTDRAPDMSDKSKLKLLNAFILETQRYIPIIPFGIERFSTRELHLDGYTIPPGTSVIVSLDSVLLDPAVWGDPEKFRPERFLSEDGSLNVPKEFLPYGLGKRNCIGESLANMELYLFMGALIQKFEFRPEDEDNLPTLTPTVDLSRCTKPFKVKAVVRKTST